MEKWKKRNRIRKRNRHFADVLTEQWIDTESMLYGMRDWARLTNRTVYSDYINKQTGKPEIVQKLVDMFDGITKILNYEQDKIRGELEEKYNATRR